MQEAPPSGQDLAKMKPGTFSFRLNVPVAEGERRVNIPIDVVIQPKKPLPSRLPILIEAKSAGDFTNTNKRRKEEGPENPPAPDDVWKGHTVYPFSEGLLRYRVPGV
jgi:hypothetical protein